MTAHAVIEKPKAAPARRSDLQGSDANIDFNTLGGRLAYARLREEMTQEQLGRAIDKVRATVVAYETNKIMPPIPIVEALARRLNVSASFLAFGEHTTRPRGAVKAAAAAASTVNVTEITYGRDGPYASGTYALPRSVAESYVADLKDLKVYVLRHHAEAFNLRAGDRLFVDTSVGQLNRDYDTYLIEAPDGLEIARIPATFTETASIMLEGSKGDKSRVKSSSLKIIGAVVSTLRKQ